MQNTVEINIQPGDINKTSMDEWGAAYLWIGDVKGVEYNLCYDDGENYSAIYPMYMNEDGDMETDTNSFVHYKIDFEDPDWKTKLTTALYDASHEFELV